jgi:MerR family transcriptional regulator, redox-sensitive transcriptional activator SoxR
MDGLPELRIGEVAERAGVATSAIRYYERIGLLPEAQRVSGQRRYDESVVGTLAFIGVAQTAGFTLAEIAELIDGAGGEAGMSDTMRSLSRRKLPEVEAQLERAREMSRWLHVASDCECETPEECALFDAEGPTDAAALRVVQVEGGCRRPSVR